MSVETANPAAPSPAPTANALGVAVHRGRWGFHPCGPEAFREIKEFHRLALRDYAATKRRDRWRAKRPCNRVRRDGSAIPEPACVGTRRDEYFRILEAYRDARRPRATADEVEELAVPRDWRARLAGYREALG